MNTAHTKPFKSYEDQIALLKSRGMVISDDAAAIETLKQENYYRLSGYWLTMLRKDASGVESFYPGTSFDDVVDLYKFDQQLRSLVMMATAIIETNLKAYVAYYHAQKYGPCGYINNANSENPWNHAKFMNALSGDFSKRREELFVKHHKEDLAGVYPVWVVTEICSFDQISKFYSNMLPADRLKIAKDYYHIPSREYVESWLHVAVVARNMAAHGARFYNKSYLKPAVSLPKHLNHYASAPFGYIYALYTLLPPSDQRNFLDQTSRLIEKHEYTKLQYLGFPTNWKALIIQGANKSPIPTYTSEMHIDIERYLSYSWDWSIITKLINRVHGHTYLASDLHAAYDKYKAAP